MTTTTYLPLYTTPPCTTPGSVIAYGKLSEQLSSAALALPGRDQINMGLGAASALGLIGFCASSDPTIATLALTTGDSLLAIPSPLLHLSAHSILPTFPPSLTLPLLSHLSFLLTPRSLISSFPPPITPSFH